ncbi:MAG: hypothetical protein KME16_25235 [Scytolyngbya sp. HA4215-MV1]|nr:hypothetical protein [Scytolyngbya sp. HA4215-MV1]
MSIWLPSYQRFSQLCRLIDCDFAGRSGSNGSTIDSTITEPSVASSRAKILPQVAGSSVVKPVAPLPLQTPQSYFFKFTTVFWIAQEYHLFPFHLT